MKKVNILNFLLVALVVIFSLTVRAQNDPPPDVPNSEIQRPPNKGANLLRELGLSREQMRAIRRLNAERKNQMEDAQRRLREARRDLDIAIYADTVSDADIQARLKDFQTAQSDVAVIRATTEYEIRKILTPEQVARFRELRQRFNDAREDFQNRPKNQRQNLQRNRQNKFTNRQNQKP